MKMAFFKKQWLRLSQFGMRFLADLRGVSTVEYALIVVGIIGIVGAGVVLLGGAFTEMFEELSERMTAAVT